MVLNELNLNSFKNYNDCSLNFNNNFNFIYGDNGNGKTNLLESISMLCLTKSFISSSDPDCLMYGQDSFTIAGKFTGEINHYYVDYIFDKLENTKRILLNKEKVRKNSEIIGNFPIIALSPKDSKVINGSPQERRKNFDIILSQDRRLYLDHLKNYNRVLEQRNMLLKDYVQTKRYSKINLLQLLEPWTEKLIEFGAMILLKRFELIAKLTDYIIPIYKKLSSSDIIPMINYRMFGEELSSEIRNIRYEDLYKLFLNTQKRFEELEMIRGVSMTGPHRDDYLFYIKKNGNLFELKYFGSQGEQKLFLIALKISEFYYLKERMELTGFDLPVMLLDDLFSELDENKINCISEYFRDFGQIFFTTTNSKYSDMINNVYNSSQSSYYRITDGKAEII